MTPENLRWMIYGLELAQDEWEFDNLLEFMRGSESLLEIGSRYGESLRKMAEVCQYGSTVISVDLGGYINDTQINAVFDPLESLNQKADQILKMGHKVKIIISDSHQKDTVELVKSFGPYDFVFIDGDHSYEGVKQDWENYGPMGKKIGFHDIVGQEGVKKLWGEISHLYPHKVFYRPDNNISMGIGLLTRV